MTNIRKYINCQVYQSRTLFDKNIIGNTDNKIQRPPENPHEESGGTTRELSDMVKIQIANAKAQSSHPDLVHTQITNAKVRLPHQALSQTQIANAKVQWSRPELMKTRFETSKAFWSLMEIQSQQAGTSHERDNKHPVSKAHLANKNENEKLRASQVQ